MADAAYRVTATAWARAGTGTGARPRAEIVGPAGVALPGRSALYRKLMGPQLRRIAELSYDAWAAEQLPPALWRAAGEAARQVLAARFPASDLDVLRRHGHAIRTSASAQILFGFDRRVPIPIDPIEVAGPRGDQLAADPAVDPHVLAAPEAVTLFARRVASIRDGRNREIQAALAWPVAFRARLQRWPRWQDIEAGLPMIGSWLAGQRAAGATSTPAKETGDAR